MSYWRNERSNDPNWKELSKEEREEILRKEQQRKYRDTHKEQKSESDKKRNRENRRLCIEHYGSKCACCGETIYEFLTIDHINNNGAEERRELGINSGTETYKYLIKNNYPEGYQILCYNCNCAKGFYGYCPHQVTTCNTDCCM